ncbi:hypothetical protein [Methyloceanibacter sp.]|uniref:hypothetical protein n=1 Tax=Methyloceanibacter sp. TaxID=1965321 RepID=UPI002D48D47C|nr:hypothetical protein [Methyloceanibacter sp.]HZP08951.1 hypothetical protein [Methyloceanibacter sp.]
MTKIGLPLAIVVLLAGLFIAWSYLTTLNNVAAIAGRLPSEEQLNAMSPDELAAIKTKLTSDCERVSGLAKNPVSRYFRGDAIKVLSDRCDLIKARLGSAEGP